MQPADDRVYLDIRQIFAAMFQCIDDSCMTAPLDQNALFQQQRLFICNGIRRLFFRIQKEWTAAIFTGKTGDRTGGIHTRQDLCGRRYTNKCQRIFRHGKIPHRLSRMTTEAFFFDSLRGEDCFSGKQSDPAGMIVMTVGEKHMIRQVIHIHKLAIFFQRFARTGIEQEFFPVLFNEQGKPMLRRQTGQSMVFNEDGASHIRGTRQQQQPADCVRSS